MNEVEEKSLTESFMDHLEGIGFDTMSLEEGIAYIRTRIIGINGQPAEERVTASVAKLFKRYDLVYIRFYINPLGHCVEYELSEIIYPGDLVKIWPGEIFTNTFFVFKRESTPHRPGKELTLLLENVW
jgi:hypothetical protein